MPSALNHPWRSRASQINSSSCFILLCSGKVYYDLLERRRAEEIDDIAIVRVEQLYPFPDDDVAAILKKYKNAEELYWVQEEPINMGAWYTSQHRLNRVKNAVNPNLPLKYAGRDSSASPAAGYMALHLKQLEEFICDALDLQG